MFFYTLLSFFSILHLLQYSEEFSLSTPPPIYPAGKVSNGKGLCKTNEFECNSPSRCISNDWVCDMEWDCDHGEDELDCPLATGHKCLPNQYKCSAPIVTPIQSLNISDKYLAHLLQPGAPFIPTCIDSHWLCDGEADCFNGDDEENCSNIGCNATQFACTTFDRSGPACIPKEWVCDGQTDCRDQLDEKNCPAKTCDKQEFRCHDGQCIFQSWRCDGDHDCTDGSDEIDCASDVCSSLDKYKCKSGHCIPKSWRCDGESDCSDHSDEIDCPTVTPIHPVHCKENEFACASKSQCISEHFVCDGDNDCFDKSDENNCKLVECPAGKRACKDGKCLDNSQFCDGAEDCIDGSDEQNCSTKAISDHHDTCDPRTEYSCPEKPIKCIKYEDLCNDKSSSNDCIPSACNKQILECNERFKDGCRCRSMAAIGRLCYCDNGYENRNGTCVDINECLQQGSCDQICVNQPGSFYCSCYPGFRLTNGPRNQYTTSLKMHKCRAVGGDPLLLLANRATIRQFDIVTNRYHPVINSLESAVALDYWHEKKLLIWSDVSKEQISLCNIGNDTHTAVQNFVNCIDDNRTLISDHVVTPDGLAIDWVHGLLYWTDTGLDTISVFDLETSKRAVIIDKNLDEPRAIVVDPSAGLIFWSDWGSRPRIERAGMDGNHRMELISGDSIKWPNGLAVDILDRKLYWADAKMKTISSCDYWGKQVRTVLHSHTHLQHPFSLAVFEERIYWTDWDQEGVISANKFTGDDIKMLMRGISGPMAVRVYHKQAQPTLPNKCERHNCDHLCLPRAIIRGNHSDEEMFHPSFEDRFACACETGFMLKDGSASICIQRLTSVPGMMLINDGNESSSNLFTYTFALLLVAFAFLLVSQTVSIPIIFSHNDSKVYSYYRQRPRGGQFSALHFENPVYRRTVEADLDADMAGSGEGPLGVISILPVGHSSRHDPTAPPLSESLHRIDSSGQGSAKLVMQPPNSGRNTGDEFLIGGPATMLSLNDPNKMHGQPPPAYTPRAGDYS